MTEDETGQGSAFPKVGTDREAAPRRKPKVLAVAVTIDGGVPFSANSDQSAEGLLETCRTQWQYGEWEDLAALDEATFSSSRDRAKL